MSKALNSFIEKAAENTNHITKLSIIDFFHPLGVREKTVIRPKNKNPQVRMVTEVRRVTYLYDKKVTQGFEIVKEILVPRGSLMFEPNIVAEITRDFRDPNYKEPNVAVDNDW